MGAGVPGSGNPGTLQYVQPGIEMKIREKWGFAPLGALSIAFVVWLLAGCGILDEGEPKSARILIEGAEGETFQLVTSNDFLVVLGEEEGRGDVFLNSADTATVSAPLSERYLLGPNRRFYALASSEDGLSEPITMRVLVGGEERYRSTSTLEGIELEFVYTIR
jgi:hypothetical protein